MKDTLLHVCLAYLANSRGAERLFWVFFFFASASSQLSLVQNNPYAKVALRVAYFATLQLTASVPFLMPIL
jgi:hypothetical protein